LGKYTPVGKGQLLQQPSRLARFQRRDDHGDLVARLDHVELPAHAVEDTRACTLHRVALGVTVLVTGGECDVHMRIVPLEARNRACQLDLVIAVVHRE
jgi:hypothetical protein